MNKNLLILGAGCCGLAARETAEAMGCFGKIDFLDDNIGEMPDGSKILGKVCEFENFTAEYNNIFVAIANPEIKLNLLNKINETTPYKIVTLVSPRAYISPTAQIMPGTLVEAMATVNTGSVVSMGCIIGAGSVVNHLSMCCDGVHLECNATVADNTLVPAGTYVGSGDVFTKRGSMDLLNKTSNDLEHNAAESEEKQICSSCAEGAYWLKLDPNEVLCPRISMLHDGKCSAYRKI